jgi:hypothetical protein
MSLRVPSIFLILTLLVPAGCLKKKQISGKEFVPREVLVDVLVDIHLMDGITNDRKFYRRYEDVDSVDLLGPILEKHKISLQMFDTTMYEYSRHPLLLDQVYNDVLMKLNIMLDENDQAEDPGKLVK